MRNGELEGARELSADPMEGIKTRTAAMVFAAHLPHYYLRIRENMERASLQTKGALESLEQSYVLGNIIILPPNPLRDSYGSARGPGEHDADTGWSGVPQRAAIDISYKIIHCSTDIGRLMTYSI
jgi:hypothetical protein